MVNTTRTLGTRLDHRLLAVTQAPLLLHSTKPPNNISPHMASLAAAAAATMHPGTTDQTPIINTTHSLNRRASMEVDSPVTIILACKDLMIHQNRFMLAEASTTRIQDMVAITQDSPADIRAPQEDIRKDQPTHKDHTVTRGSINTINTVDHPSHMEVETTMRTGNHPKEGNTDHKVATDNNTHRHHHKAEDMVTMAATGVLLATRSLCMHGGWEKARVEHRSVYSNQSKYLARVQR